MGLWNWLSSSWRQPLPEWEDEQPATGYITSPEGWEEHPCALPTDIGITAVGLVWRCPERNCQRRWRLDRAEFSEDTRLFRRGYWTELMSATPVSDRELEDLLITEDPDAAA